MRRSFKKYATLGVLIAATLTLSVPAHAATSTTEIYDDFSAPSGYGVSSYDSKWTMPYGRLSLDAGGTQSFAGGKETVDAAPFRIGADFSVYDHLKYMGVATKAFAVPAKGSVTFESTITALTPGTDPGRVVTGTYMHSGAPYAAPTIEAQQAGVVMNVVDFCTGQLFDWFVTSTTAVPLIERLPTNVTANTSNPNCPGAKHVGADLMYTQLIREIPIQPGVPQRVGITYERGGSVIYTLNGIKVAKVQKVGVPLDVQGVPFLTDTYPSLGPGEQVDSQISSLSLAHGLFSLIDAFPFQHPDAPSLSVSVPMEQRLFGQGAIGSWDDFTVTTLKK